jgi:glutamine synthetase
MMARTMILPAALRYQEQVAKSVAALAGAGVQVPGRQKELLGTLTSTIEAFQAATDKLDRALNHHAEGDLLAHAKYARDHVVTGMAEVRKLGDTLETLVADDLWPLPTYREMLFMK